MTKSPASSLSHFIVWLPSIRRRPFSRPAFAVFFGLSGGDGDAVFENEVGVVADSFRASIIFRLPRHQRLCITALLWKSTPFAYQCGCSMILSVVNCSVKMSVWRYGRDTDIEQERAETESWGRRESWRRIGKHAPSG